jgi:hypothetical protein
MQAAAHVEVALASPGGGQMTPSRPRHLSTHTKTRMDFQASSPMGSVPFPTWPRTSAVSASDRGLARFIFKTHHLAAEGQSVAGSAVQ